MRVTMAFVACGLLALVAAPAIADPARSVIFIMADDLNCDLGCYGNTQVRTPQLDRLAARAVRFERAYCQYPVCNPSRTSLLSGRYPTQTGVIDNVTPPRTHLKDLVFLPQHFRQQGYRTLKVGKIFHTGDAFEDADSWDVDVREDRTAKNPPAEQIAGRRGQGGIVLDADDADTWDGQVARQGLELLREAAGSAKPFFLAIGFRRPHTPYIAPRKYHELYPAANLQFAPEDPSATRDLPRWALTYLCGAKRLTAKDRAETAAAYYASLSFIDAQLGLLLDAIDQLRLWEHSLVIFVSDHGYHLGDHGGLWHKMTLFEQGTRVPLLIAAPGVAPATAGATVELVDLYPTCCEIAGLPAPPGLQGQSLVPWLRNPARRSARAACTVVSRTEGNTHGPLDATRMGTSLRTDRYRYTRWFDGSQQLYDLEQDPHEARNLAGRAEHAPLLAEMQQLLLREGPAAR